MSLRSKSMTPSKVARVMTCLLLCVYIVLIIFLEPYHATNLTSSSLMLHSLDAFRRTPVRQLCVVCVSVVPVQQDGECLFFLLDLSHILAAMATIAAPPGAPTTCTVIFALPTEIVRLLKRASADIERSKNGKISCDIK